MMRITDPEILGFFNTLLLLPDDVVLDLATRQFNMQHPMSCVTGWALRAGLSRLDGKSPDEVVAHGWPSDVAKLFGGTVPEWRRIFVGVVRGKQWRIEAAFVERLDVALSQ